MTRVLVTGSDRPIGKALLAELVAHHMAPVAAVGDASGTVMSIDQDVIASGRIDIDLDSHGSISAALDGVDALVHPLDARPGGSDDIPDSVRAMASACADRNVHLIMVSRVNAELSSLSHRKRLWQAEQVIEQTDGLDYTIQRITHTHPSLERLMQGPWLPLPKATPVQPVSPADVASRIVELIENGPGQRARDFGGPELMRFADAAHIYKQVRGDLPRRIPLLPVGVLAEALDGVHVTRTGDRGTETFRQWLER